MCDGRESNRGFTLVETIAVIALFGLLVAIAVPGTAALLRSTRLTGASNEMVADFYYARSLAKAQRSTHEIRFTSGGYSLVRVQPPRTVVRRVLPSDVSCTASDTASFYGWGLTSPMTVTLRNARTTEVVRLSANGSVSRD